MLLAAIGFEPFAELCRLAFVDFIQWCIGTQFPIQPTGIQPQVAFGGLKASGYGRFNGVEAIDEFTDTRVMTIRSQPAHYPI